MSLNDILNSGSENYYGGEKASIKFIISSDKCSDYTFSAKADALTPTGFHNNFPNFNPIYIKGGKIEIRTIIPSGHSGLLWTKTFNKNEVAGLSTPNLNISYSVVTTQTRSGGTGNPGVSVYFPIDMGGIVLYNEDDLNWGGAGFDPSQITAISVVEWLMAENPDVLDEIVAYMYDNGIISPVDYDDYFDMIPTMTGAIYIDGEYSDSAVWLPPAVSIVKDGDAFAGVFEIAESLIDSGDEVTISEIERIINGEE